MATDADMQALRDAGTRNRPGFDEWLDRLDDLRVRIAADPAGTRPRQPLARRHRRALCLTAAATVLVLGAIAGGLTLNAATPSDAAAAARKAVAATAAVTSGTMRVTVAHSGTTSTVSTARWNGHDIAVANGTSDQSSADHEVILHAGNAYVRGADGSWRQIASIWSIGQSLPPQLKLAQGNVAGSTANQILALASGLTKTTQPNGTTVYTGTIPSTGGDTAGTPGDDLITRAIAGLRGANDTGGQHGDVQLQMTVGADGLVQQISLIYDRHDAGSPAQDGTYAVSVTYSQLDATPPINVPASGTSTQAGSGTTTRP